MSNRLADAGYVPLLPDPLLAARAGAAFAESRLRSVQACDLGRAFFALPTASWTLARRLAKAIENALYLRTVASMSDHLLADIGLRRDQLPQLFLEGRLADIAGDVRRRGRG